MCRYMNAIVTDIHTGEKIVYVGENEEEFESTVVGWFKNAPQEYIDCAERLVNDITGGCDLEDEQHLYSFLGVTVDIIDDEDEDE